MKHCSKCGQAKLVSEFSLASKSPDGLRKDCKDCCALVNAAWRAKNKEYIVKASKKWKLANPERYLELKRSCMKKAYHSNPEKHRDISKKWATANKDVRAAKQARRRTSCHMATPKWANLFAIAEIYAFAQEFRDAGFSVDVDHIYPLKGKTVSGLHTEGNLRVCLANVNRSKGNKQVEFFQ